MVTFHRDIVSIGHEQRKIPHLIGHTSRSYFENHTAKLHGSDGSDGSDGRRGLVRVRRVWEVIKALRYMADI